MLNLVDIKKGLYGAEIKKRRHFILFILSTLLTIALIVILMITSKQKYILELIFSILFGSIYLIYLVFYFTVIRRSIASELRFFEGKTQMEVAEEIGISQAQISRLEKNALKNMKKHIQ